MPINIWKFENVLRPLNFSFIDGVADAAILGAGVSILMKLFPKKVYTIISWTEILFGLGFMLGKKIFIDGMNRKPLSSKLFTV